MIDQEYRGNMNYPFQDHIVLNVEENVAPFPRTNLRKCQHAQVEIDTKALKLTCMKCGAKVNPAMGIKDTMLYWSRQQTRIAEQKKQIVKALMSLRKEQEPSVSTAIG